MPENAGQTSGPPRCLRNFNASNPAFDYPPPGTRLKLTTHEGAFSFSSKNPLHSPNEVQPTGKPCGNASLFGGFMTDAIFIVTIVAFFLASGLYVVFCEKL
jgi:hypothetical protein